METIATLFSSSGLASTLLYLCLTALIGIAIGKVEVKNIKLGIAGVLFAGIGVSHFGAETDPHILHFVKEFGLILFVYAIGIDVGPRFFSTLRKEGLKLNLLAFSIVAMGFGIAYVIYLVADLSAAEITGILSGAVTNTPSLGAAQQLIIDSGNKDAEVAGMAYAVAYPFGIIGIILTMLLIRRMFKIDIDKEVADYNQQIGANRSSLESVEIRVTNPNLLGKKLAYIKALIDKELVISRIERDNEFIIANDEVELQSGDIVYGVSTSKHLASLRMKMGEVEIGGKKEVSGNLGIYNVLVTNRKIAGKTIEQIGIYRRYEANITRIFRAGMEILPTLTTTIELGDTVRIVGKKAILKDVQKEIGDSLKELSSPNVLPIFLGIFAGVILGSMPIVIPGLPFPAKLGLAGGPLLVAILLGYKGRIGKLDFYMNPGANMMLKELGIILFLSAVGLSSGGKFVETLAHGGYMWMLYGMAITFIPILIVGIYARIRKYNYLKICGIISGAMTDPPALEFANAVAPIQAQSTAYATVYPLTMFLRILFAQILVLLIL
jgi:putative transport protein